MPLKDLLLILAAVVLVTAADLRAVRERVARLLGLGMPAMSGSS